MAYYQSYRNKIIIALLKSDAPIYLHRSRHAKVAPLGSMVFLLPTVKSPTHYRVWVYGISRSDLE